MEHQLLSKNQKLDLAFSPEDTCIILEYLAEGTQGQVYKAEINKNPVAVKWYFPQMATTEQLEIIKQNVERKTPNNSFLWPINIVTSTLNQDFGYVMPLRKNSFKSSTGLLTRKIEPSFKTIAKVGFNLAESFFQLHSKGLCYYDISNENIFIDPDNGDILICDNDNVSFNGDTRPRIDGTPRYMAPEIVIGESRPNSNTDLFSLAVLLFYTLMISHPLEGLKESQIKCFDSHAMRRLYGLEPIFIFDPDDDTNRPDPKVHSNAIEFWKIYPEFIRQLFIKSFTKGLHDINNRVQESIWRQAMLKLIDSIIYCINDKCKAENFYDAHFVKKNNGKVGFCWACDTELQSPIRMKIGENILTLNHGSNLYDFHLNNYIAQDGTYNFSNAIGEVVPHPSIPNIWGIKNLSSQNWVIKGEDGMTKDVNPGKSVTLKAGIKINFGRIEAEVRL